MAQNQAAWITAPAAYPFTIDTAPIPKPGPCEVVIKNVAVAINPVDWKIQSLGRYLEKYPFVLGEDAAGTIEAVGSCVSRFKKGQRVIAHCNGLMTQDPASAAFQLYPVVTESLVAELPDSVTFEQGVVLPLAISTACAGLYREDYLGLPLPAATDVKPAGQTILVWGGASSVGVTAIQLAVASGLTVLTTASAANHDLVKSLGAHSVIDYRSPSIVEDVVNALANTNFVGVYDAISEDVSFSAISAILDELNTTVKVASVMPCNKSTERFAPKYVIAYSIIEDPHHGIGEWVWSKYVPQALANGSLQSKPDPFVVGNGLKDIQHGLDVQKKGVSARKVVIVL
ncbi:chaperonin 10-like protein [Penicillium samsonianum]|uniref:chaperonin 10-like protein n=1 Tax=Penicillium samsonianum TaxID=1882272 RepID=UPI002547D9D2|nr:chaperonin 10-like protein [Penicillium samsonianum]KAJ6125614.1 chaperonin 10-like protein [Penicillium samsonianum]